MPSKRTATLLRVLLAIYLLALAFIVFAPGDEAERVTGVVALTAVALESLGLPFDVGYPIVEFSANVALFAPFGVLLALLAPRVHVTQLIATGALLSLVIELTQMLLPTRYPTLSDVIANTLGTALGAAAVLIVRRMSRRNRRTVQR